MPPSALSLAVPSPRLPSSLPGQAGMKQWGVCSSVFQCCWMDAHPGLALCCAQVCAPPAKPSALPCPGASSGSPHAGGEGAGQGPTHTAYAAPFPFASVQLFRRCRLKCYPSTQDQFLNEVEELPSLIPKLTTPSPPQPGCVQL